MFALCVSVGALKTCCTPEVRASQTLSAASASASVSVKSCPDKILRTSEGRFAKNSARLSVSGSSLSALIFRKRGVDALRIFLGLRFAEGLDQSFLQSVVFVLSWWTDKNRLNFFCCVDIKCTDNVVIFCVVLGNAFRSELRFNRSKPHFWRLGPKF